MSQINKKNEAIKSLVSSNTMDPNRADTHYYLGMAYMSKNNWRLAQSELENALSLSPENADIYDKLGIAYAQEKMWEKAGEAFKSALNLNQLHPSAKINLERLEKKIIAEKR